MTRVKDAMKRPLTLALLLFLSLAALVWLLIGLASAAVAATSSTTQTIVLYDGGLGTLPGDQGFDFLAFPAGATQTISSGGAILDTLASQGIYAGYFGRAALIPTLDRTAGFTATFSARLLSEIHSSLDRAGFSLIILGDDSGGTEPVQGIELAFWPNEIWAQDDDTQGGTLFTHAEGVPFDTSLTHLYQVAVLSATYTLLADGAAILSGRIRNYTNFAGVPDPYETPNFLFLGDDTSSAAARLKLDYVALTVPGGGPPGSQYLPLIRRP